MKTAIKVTTPRNAPAAVLKSSFWAGRGPSDPQGWPFGDVRRHGDLMDESRKVQGLRSAQVAGGGFPSVLGQKGPSSVT